MKRLILLSIGLTMGFVHSADLILDQVEFDNATEQKKAWDSLMEYTLSEDFQDFCCNVSDKMNFERRWEKQGGVQSKVNIASGKVIQRMVNIQKPKGHREAINFYTNCKGTFKAYSSFMKNAVSKTDDVYGQFDGLADYCSDDDIKAYGEWLGCFESFVLSVNPPTSATDLEKLKDATDENKKPFVSGCLKFDKYAGDVDRFIKSSSQYKRLTGEFVLKENKK